MECTSKKSQVKHCLSVDLLGEIICKFEYMKAFDKFTVLMCIRWLPLLHSPRSSAGLERRTYTQYRSNADVVSSSLTGGIFPFFVVRSMFCCFWFLLSYESFFCGDRTSPFLLFTKYVATKMFVLDWNQRCSCHGFVRSMDRVPHQSLFYITIFPTDGATEFLKFCLLPDHGPHGWGNGVNENKLIYFFKKLWTDNKKNSL